MSTLSPVIEKRMSGRPLRLIAVARLAAVAVFLAVLIGVSTQVPESAYALSPADRYQAPGAAAWFGTDALGRDLFWRTIRALSTSFWIGLFAAAVSTLIALVIGILGALSARLDHWAGLLTELVLGLPHLVLLLLIAFALGGGSGAVIIALAVTHWPRLSRVIRAETQALLQSDFVMVSRRLGRSPLWIARHHYLPHLLPQLIAGFVLMFPHAILHEAALSFLGMGVEPHLPAIGVMLNESLGALSAGYWWLAVLPGLGLVALALSFELLGESIRRLFSLQEAQL